MKHLKKQMYTFLESIDISNIEIISCHYVKSSDDVIITLKNIRDKIEVFKKQKLCPATFTVTDNIGHTYGLTETFYNKYCKYTLGISKYSSKTLTLGELGRYPILIKQIVLGILHWWRLEQGTENTLLNKAFIVTKEENHPWLQNIKYLLYKIGLGDIWLSSGMGEAMCRHVCGQVML